MLGVRVVIEIMVSPSMVLRKLVMLLPLLPIIFSVVISVLRVLLIGVKRLIIGVILAFKLQIIEVARTCYRFG